MTENSDIDTLPMRPRPWWLLHIPAPCLCVLLLQLLSWAWCGFVDEERVFAPLPERIVELIASGVVILASFQLVNVAVPLGRRFLRRTANLTLVLLFAALLLFHHITKHAVDFYFLGDNFQELFYAESLSLVASSISPEVGITCANVLLLLLIITYGTAAFANWPTTQNWKVTTGASGVCLVTVFLSPLYAYNDLTFFLRSAADFTLGLHSSPGMLTVEEYPYTQEADSINQDELEVGGELPYVFLVMLESFNSNLVNARDKSGNEYTPFFNSLIDRGLYVDRFYGNSIQTARGQIPVLCSILPSVWGKILTDYPDLRLNSLPAILQSRGFHTLYFQGQQSLAYDDTGRFMAKNGFMEVYSMDEQFVSEDEEKYVWGWGLQDNLLYRKALHRLDVVDARGNGPCFVTIATTSHHYPFNEMPENQRFLYRQPQSKEEWFATSIHLSDRYLREFFSELEKREYLKQSVIIITGDHSFPAGEHGNHFNESKFYEENFRVPLLMIWDGKIDPQRVRETVYSQLDIAPTILDAVNISADNHFLGQSMLGVTDKRPIHLIQPYDGTHLCVIDFPWKYVKSVRVPGEYLFNLESDPNEENNLIRDFRGTPTLAHLRKEIRQIHLNQQLIERNRIWHFSSESQ